MHVHTFLILFLSYSCERHTSFFNALHDWSLHRDLPFLGLSPIKCCLRYLPSEILTGKTAVFYNLISFLSVTPLASAPKTKVPRYLG